MKPPGGRYEIKDSLPLCLFKIAKMQIGKVLAAGCVVLVDWFLSNHLSSLRRIWTCQRATHWATFMNSQLERVCGLRVISLKRAHEIAARIKLERHVTWRNHLVD